jgi:5-enolpyruvylshikimate-3-phosphate synthase
MAAVARTQGETTIAEWESVATSYPYFTEHLREGSGAETTLNG